MDRHFKVRAKEDFIYKGMGKEIPIKKGEIYPAKDIIVTVNKQDQRSMGFYVEGAFYDSHNFEHKFEEIKD